MICERGVTKKKERGNSLRKIFFELLSQPCGTMHERQKKTNTRKCARKKLDIKRKRFGLIKKWVRPKVTIVRTDLSANKQRRATSIAEKRSEALVRARVAVIEAAAVVVVAVALVAKWVSIRVVKPRVVVIV
jgi:hypothetical protein